MKGDVTKLNTTSLETIGEICVNNRVGVSFNETAQRKGGAILRDILGHIQAFPYRDNTGKVSFFIPQESDTPHATKVELKDVVAFQNEGVGDFSIVKTTHKDIGLCSNRRIISYINRLNGYKNPASFPLDDPFALSVDGNITMDKIHYRMFSNPASASKMGWKAWRQGRFSDRVHETLLNGRWLWVQPGQVLTLDIPEANLNDKRVRVFSIDDPPLDGANGAAVKITYQMDDDFLTSFEEIEYDSSISQDTSIGPPSEVEPIVWEEDARYNDDEYTIGLTAIREDSNTSSVEIWVSVGTADNFVYYGEMGTFANVSDLVGTIDDSVREMTINTDAYEGSIFPAYTEDNQLYNLSYCLVGKPILAGAGMDELEFITYRGTRVSGDDLILENLIRGKDYTNGKAHGSGTVILLVGQKDNYFKIPITKQDVGKRIYVKMVPSNIRGYEIPEEDVDYVVYTIQGYTRMATPTHQLELVEGGIGLGGAEYTVNSDVIIQWEKTNRNSGPGSKAYGTWEYNDFEDGDVDDHDIIVYEADGVSVRATHPSIGNVQTYTYTNAQNSTDFGGSPSDHFWLGVRPVVTGRGRYALDITKKEIYRV
jgi:hypothetical protein